MGKDKFEINLDNPKSVYYPGQTVSGKVDLKLDDDMKVRGKSNLRSTFSLFVEPITKAES